LGAASAGGGVVSDRRRNLDDKVREVTGLLLKRAHAEMLAASAEVERLWKENEKLRGPFEKKKSGRPSIWKGIVGFKLVNAVETILIEKMRGQEEAGEEEENEEEVSQDERLKRKRRRIRWDIDPRDPEEYALLRLADEVHAHRTPGSRRLYSLAQAIRLAVKTDPSLQRHRAVFSRLSDRALQARYQQAADCWSSNRIDASDREWKAAMDRWKEANEKVQCHCDFLDTFRARRPTRDFM
jgi:hypothetical protein